MKRFTKKQRAWLLVRLNKIAQLKKDCIECNRDNISLTAENNALRTSDDAKASRIADLIGEGQRLRTNRDDWMRQARELRDTLHAVRVEDTKLALKVRDLTGQINHLSERLGNAQHERDEFDAWYHRELEKKLELARHLNGIRRTVDEMKIERDKLRTQLQAATDEWRKWQKKYTDAGFRDDEYDKLRAEIKQIEAVSDHRYDVGVELEKANSAQAKEITRLTGICQRYYNAGSKQTEEIKRLTAENETIATALQASANLRYGLAKRLADADLLVAGLTILTDRFERRAIKAERREVDL